MPHHALMPSVSVKHIWPSLHVPALHGFCAVQCAPVPAMDSYPSSHWQVRPRQRALSPHVSLDVHDKGPVLHLDLQFAPGKQQRQQFPPLLSNLGRLDRPGTLD